MLFGDKEKKTPVREGISVSIFSGLAEGRHQGLILDRKPNHSLAWINVIYCPRHPAMGVKDLYVESEWIGNRTACAPEVEASLEKIFVDQSREGLRVRSAATRIEAKVLIDSLDIALGSGRLAQMAFPRNTTAETSRSGSSQSCTK
jgi:hypothetical protein